jgi:predicted SAM-dependent methyltransferase
MSITKSMKNMLRKYLFQPLGYDVVPMKKPSQLKSKARTQEFAAEGSGPNQTGQYIEIFGEEAVCERRFYNLGAEASFKHPAWTVINLPSEHYGEDYMDISWDLMSREPLPIEDEKARVIFSRYTLEHVDDGSVEHFLIEANRALSGGGTLRLIVPDIDIFYLAYLAKAPDIFYRPKQDLEIFPNEKFSQNPNRASFEQRFLWWFASNASELHPDGASVRISDQDFRKVFKELSFEEAMNYCTSKCSLVVQKKYRENHINWFNADKLLRMLKDAGFTNSYRSGFGQSRCPILREVSLLEARQPEIGLFVEAVKQQD